MVISTDEKKSIGISAALSTMVSAVTVLGVLWVIAKPVLIDSISTAMAEDLDEQIQTKLDTKLDPLNAGFKAIIQLNVNSLRREIAAAEFARRTAPDGWTESDNAELTQMRIDLDEQVAVLQAIVSAEN